MLDDYKDSQPIAYKILVNTIKNNKDFHAYLVETNESTDGLSIALAFAKALLCPKRKTNHNNCDGCNQCQIIDDNNSLEIKIINADGMWIKKDQIIDLQQEFSRKAIIGTKKIYIINEVEKLNSSSANSILKFLEEPQSDIIAILLTDNSYQILETIISRCMLIPLRKNVSEDGLATIDILDKQLYKNSDIDQKFANNPKKCDTISSVLNFIIFYEDNGKRTIAHVPRLLYGIVDTKENVELLFDLMILIYKDALNIICSENIKYFNDYHDKIIKISTLTTAEKICDKIRLIISAKSNLKINANVNLLLDNLLIKMKEGE